MNGCVDGQRQIDEWIDNDFIGHTHRGESIDPWWLARGDYNYEDQQSDDNCSDQSNESISDTEGYNMTHRTAKFTEYSMTSSVVPRSEGEVNKI